MYFLAGEELPGSEIENRHLEILARVKESVSVPVAVKLSPYFSSTAEMDRRLDPAGADAPVLFNRLMQPDIDTANLRPAPAVGRSRPAEGHLPRLWIALLSGRVSASLAGTTGVEGAEDLVRYLLAGGPTW